jgi:hypothetical protein
MALQRFLSPQHILRSSIPFAPDPADPEEQVYGCTREGRSKELDEMVLNDRDAQTWYVVKPPRASARKNLESVEARIRRLVEDGSIREARELVSKTRRGSSKSLDIWRRLLAEPRATQVSAASGGRLRANLDWLRKNSRQYGGLWVALKDGRLLGSNPRRFALRSELKRSKQLKNAVFFRVEE